MKFSASPCHQYIVVFHHILHTICKNSMFIWTFNAQLCATCVHYDIDETNIKIKVPRMNNQNETESARSQILTCIKQRKTELAWDKKKSKQHVPRILIRVTVWGVFLPCPNVKTKGIYTRDSIRKEWFSSQFTFDTYTLQ